jgi:phage-related protein
VESVADWKLKIIVDAATKGAEDAIGGLKGSLGKLGDGFDALGKVGMVGLGAVATAAGAAAVGVAKLAVDAAPLENVRAAFEGLAKSAGKSGDEMLAALQKASGGMISQIDLMKSFNLAAQLVGQDFAVRLPEAMQYLAKVSAATGESMDFMLESLIRGVGRLSPMILDNLGIQVSLNEATARAAEMFGVEADQLTKSQIQAGMLDVVLTKLRENTAAMPDVTWTAAAGLGWLKATFADLKEQIGAAFLPVLAPLLQAFRDLASAYLPIVVAWLQDFGMKLGDLVTALLNAGVYSEQFKAALANLVGPEAAVQIISLIQTIQTLAQEIVTFVSQHAEAFKAAIIGIGAVIAAAALVTAITGIAGAIASLANPIGLIVAAIGVLAAAWVEDWGGIQEKTQAALSFISNAINTALTAIQGWWCEHGQTVTGIVNELWNSVQSAFQFAFNVVSGLVQTSLTFWQNLWQQHGQTVTGIVNELWNSVQSAFQFAFNVVSGLVQTSLTFWQNLWQQHGQFITQTVQQYWKMVKGIFQTIFQAFDYMTKAILAAMQGNWYKFGENLRLAVQTMWDGIKNVFQQSMQIIVNIFTYLIQQIISAVRNTDWQALGRSIVDGIKAGVQAAARALADAAIAVVRAALDAARGALGIHSPSREFMQVGLDSMEGLALGILTGGGKVLAAMQKVLSEVRKEMTGTPSLGNLGGKGLLGDTSIPRLTLPPDMRGGGDLPKLSPTPTTPRGGGGGGGGGRGGGGGSDGRLVELVTEIRDMLAEEFGIDKSKFAQGDLQFRLAQVVM